MEWEQQSEINPVHEANFLKLDCSKIKSVLNWDNTWDIEESVKRTVDWSKTWIENPKSIRRMTEQQIQDFCQKRK